MSHLLRSLPGALNADQLVIAPERPIEQQHIDGIQFLSAARP